MQASARIGWRDYAEAAVTRQAAVPAGSGPGRSLPDCPYH